MKRSLVFLAVVGVLGLSFIITIIIRDLKHRSWMEYTSGEINRLAVGVEAFHEEQGVFPEKLSDLQNVPGLHHKEYLMEILAGQSGSQYQYRVVSNGFVITVIKSAQLLSKNEVMEKFFEKGVALGGEVEIITVTKSGVTNGVPDNKK